MADASVLDARSERHALSWPGDAMDRRLVGGKAAALAALEAARIPGCAIPPWFVILADVSADDDQLHEHLSAALGTIAPNGEPVAVRSSSVAEDGAEDSYAGQLESFLFVAHTDVLARVRDVQRSAASARVGAYETARGRQLRARGTAVIVQRMVDADVAGVAFSADPASGRRGVAVVAAVRGTGDVLVQGEADAEEWRIDRGARIVERRIAGDTPVLDEARAIRVAAAARAAARHFGLPQDIEWAYHGDRLFILQSRQITSLAALPDPDGVMAIWDNSNIAESYGGVTTPLTYTFARHAYEHVYRRFLLLLGVRESVVDANAEALRKMIGLIRGRVYYNLGSWYRALALLPGYSLNRPFMEQMMGVRDSVSDVSPAAPHAGRARALRDVIRAVKGLVREHRRLGQAIRQFHALVDDAVTKTPIALEEMRADELVAHYRDLESRLLARWDAPLVNDFFAMVYFGLLRVLARRWCGDADGTLPNDLVSGEGGMISAEPARAIQRMSALARSQPGLASVLANGSRERAEHAVESFEPLRVELAAYLAKFGDRCAEELKLETRTLAEDPFPVIRAIGEGSLTPSDGRFSDGANVVRANAETRVLNLLRWHPLRRSIFMAVLTRARVRVRDRENLRFERTRVFGRVRRILVELGRRFSAAGLLNDPRDVFFLEIHEVLGVVDGTATTAALQAVADARRVEFERYRLDAPPSERFETRGMVHEGNSFAAIEPEAPAPESRDVRTGTGCYPGSVRGTVRVIRDPRNASLRNGEILVAERTDPGWIMLFPRAAAILVERGSLLSHSAIVSRELGIPSIVSIAGLTTWLRTGDLIEMDGRSGVVRMIERAGPNEGEGDHDE